MTGFRAIVLLITTAMTMQRLWRRTQLIVLGKERMISRRSTGKRLTPDSDSIDESARSSRTGAYSLLKIRSGHTGVSELAPAIIIVC